MKRTICRGALIAMMSFLVLAKDPPPPPAPKEIQVRGRVICLAEEMNKVYKSNLPTPHEHIYAFKGNDGKVFTLLRSKFSESIFVDERFRSRELLLTARLFPNTQAIEVMNIKSVKDGVVQQIYYYCSICVIDMTSPGPCDCCQGPTELIEKPDVKTKAPKVQKAPSVGTGK